MYRIIRHTRVGFHNTTETEHVIWTGKYVDDMEEAYPPSTVFGADPLDRLELEDNLIRITYGFEELEEGTWSVIADPREIAPSRPMTAYEREIDAENRRLFPGDYM